jgi:hypothetical protein
MRKKHKEQRRIMYRDEESMPYMHLAPYMLLTARSKQQVGGGNVHPRQWHKKKGFKKKLNIVNVKVTHYHYD